MVAQSQLSAVSSASAAGSASTANSTGSTGSNSSSSATANDSPPWNQPVPASSPQQDAKVMSITNFLDTSNVPYSAGGSTGSSTEQDNQKLFAVYNALNNLSYLASMATRSGVTSGQAAGYDARFQAGLKQVQDYINSTSFNNFTLQLGQIQSSVTSLASVPFPTFNYTGGTVVSDGKVLTPLPNVSASQNFTIGVTEGKTTTNVVIDLSQIQGGLTLDNIINYTNQQLAAAGFDSRLQRTMTQGTIQDPSKASYGISVSQGPGETLNFSSAGATPSLYVAGSSGNSVGTSITVGGKTNTSAADQQGRLIKVSNLSGTPNSTFSVSQDPSSGNTTTTATAVDSNGNVYTLGTATGDFNSQLNQGSQDVVLTKYDSAGNVQWTRLLGSSGSANGYSLAIDSSNNIVIAGSTTANLTPGGLTLGNVSSFVAKYDSSGNQTWATQLPSLTTNQANAVSVDASGNIYIGGQTNGAIAAGQTSNGGQDGYIAKLNASGKIQYEQQVGTSGTDTVAATAMGSDGSLYVASVQNGEAILSKYANGDATSAPVWTQDLGALGNGGAIGGLTVANGKVWLSGSSSNGALTTGGQASVVGSPSGGLDAFVAGFTDNGTSATANTVTYVGTSGTDTAGKLTSDANGNVYLTGTTTGTFSSQSRSVANTPNAFVVQLNASGQVNWTQQYGGASGISTGGGVAIDMQGSSVLDALGLPHGTISSNQSINLAAATTLRAGDTFKIAIDANGNSSTRTITISQGETMSSLATKISGAMAFAGSAKVTYGNGGAALSISVKNGVSANLIAGPSGSDALARLGITPGSIANGVTTNSTSASSSNSNAKPVYGLGMTGVTLSLTDPTSAKSTKAVLSTMMMGVSGTYRATNTPAASTTAAGTSATTNGTVPGYLNNQIASYQLAAMISNAGGVIS